MAQSIAGGRIDADMPMMEAGIDSLGTVELRNTLQAAVGTAMTLPSTLAFDHPTARSLAALLQPMVSAAAAMDTSAAKASAGRAMAIGGLDARLPLGTTSMAATERLLACSRDAISEVPASRWDVGAQPSLPMARVLGMGLLLAHPHWQHSAILGPVGATPIAARSSRSARLYYPERAARPPRWRSRERHRRYRPHPAPGACVWPVGLFISHTGASNLWCHQALS